MRVPAGISVEEHLRSSFAGGLWRIAMSGTLKLDSGGTLLEIGALEARTHLAPCQTAWTGVKKLSSHGTANQSPV